MHNPTSGYDQPEKEEIFSELKKLGYDHIRYQSTKDANFKNALNEPADLLIIAGGDGTVGKVVKHMKRFDIPVGLLPLGTANNIAKTFNLCRNIAELIGSLSTFKPIPLNIGTTEGFFGKKQFLESVGFGLFAYVITECKKIKKGIREEFDSRNEEISMDLVLLKEIMKSYDPSFYHIEIDGHDYSGDYILVEVMNIRYIGPNLNMAENVDPGDDLLDVVFIKEENIPDFMVYINQRLEGKAAQTSLTAVKGRHIRISSQSKDMHIDDHVKGFEEDIEISIGIAPNKLQILAP